HRVVCGRARVAGLAGRPDGLGRELRPRRMRRRRRCVAGPGRHVDPALVPGMLAGCATRDRSVRDTLAILGGAVQPRAPTDMAEEALQLARLPGRVVAVPLGAPE